MKVYNWTEGKNLIKEFEGLRLNSYYCPAGVLTIGYGHTSNVKQSSTITLEEAENLLEEDCNKIIQSSLFKKFCEYYDFNNNEANAMLSYVFNGGLGWINQVSANFTRDKKTISEKMLLYYNDCNGRKLEGLVRRRKAEYDLFIKPVFATENKENEEKENEENKRGSVRIIFRDNNGKITDEFIAYL